MPGPITHAAVAFLARERIRQIRDALRAKEKNGPTINDVDRKIRYLAEKAYAAMSNASPTVDAPVTFYVPAIHDPAGDPVSKFLLMGAVGPEIPGYAALFAPGQQWLRDTLHKGTPDANREQVLTGSCNLALSFWRHVRPLIDADFPFAAPNTPEQRRHDDALRGMQAYVLGHFCHVAADVVSAPFVDNLEFQLGSNAPPAPRRKLTREQIFGALDVEVSRKIFRRGSETRGNHWIDWWPTPEQVPDAFYKATEQAMEEIYGAGAVRAGLAAFEEQRAKDAPPPPLSKALLRDGYEGFRAVVDRGAAWDFWDWMSATWFMFVPALAAYPLVLALPHGKHLFAASKPAGYDEKRAMFEWFVLPFAVNAIVPLGYSIVATASYLGAESEVIAGWVSTGVQIAASIVYFATLGASPKSLPWRWFLLFALPQAAYAFHIIFTLIRGGTRNRRRLELLFASIAAPAVSFLFLLFYWAFLHFGVDDLVKPASSATLFVFSLFGWSAILFGLWCIAAAILGRDTRRLPAMQHGHLLRLFDDSTLYLLQPRSTSPTLADLFYPSGRRALLKLWWEGAGAATIVARRDKLELNAGGNDVTVPAPPAGTKLSELADYLRLRVDGLLVQLASPKAADEDYELPPGLVFSDDGDAAATIEEHDHAAGVPKPLPAPEKDPYVLYHAPKVFQSVAFDRNGPSLDGGESTVAVEGVGRVTNLAGSRTVTLDAGANATKLTQLFRPGDRIEVQGGAQRVVVSVESDGELTISTPFPASPAGATFRRVALDRRNPPPVPGGWQVKAVHGDQDERFRLQGLAPVEFGAIFRPGDTIIVNPGPAQQVRSVTDVGSDTLLFISQPLDAPLNWPKAGPQPPAASFQLGASEPENLVPFLAGRDDTLESGGSVMNHAADLAALLCLGATSQLLSDAELRKNNIGSTTDLGRVYQVFRNWNLDRRRENEWKMLVLGGAESEKRGDPRAADPALPPNAPLLAENGERTLNTMGWLNVLRSWVEMAASPESDTEAPVAFRPGNPTNRQLSEAMAFLFDMPA